MRCECRCLASRRANAAASATLAICTRSRALARDGQRWSMCARSGAVERAAISLIATARCPLVAHTSVVSPQGSFSGMCRHRQDASPRIAGKPIEPPKLHLHASSLEAHCTPGVCALARRGRKTRPVVLADALSSRRCGRAPPRVRHHGYARRRADCRHDEVLIGRWTTSACRVLAYVARAPGSGALGPLGMTGRIRRGPPSAPPGWPAGR